VISHWVAKLTGQEGRRDEKRGGLTAAERDELARLRRENKSCGWSADIPLELLLVRTRDRYDPSGFQFMARTRRCFRLP